MMTTCPDEIVMERCDTSALVPYLITTTVDSTPQSSFGFVVFRWYENSNDP